MPKKYSTETTRNSMYTLRDKIRKMLREPSIYKCFIKTAHPSMIDAILKRPTKETDATQHNSLARQ